MVKVLIIPKSKATAEKVVSVAVVSYFKELKQDVSILYILDKKIFSLYPYEDDDFEIPTTVDFCFIHKHDAYIISESIAITNLVNTAKKIIIYSGGENISISLNINNNNNMAFQRADLERPMTINDLKFLLKEDDITPQYEKLKKYGFKL